MARKRSTESSLKQCSSNLTSVKRKLAGERNRLKFLERQLEAAKSTRMGRDQAVSALLLRLSRDVNLLRSQLRDKNEELHSVRSSLQRSVDTNVPEIEAKYTNAINQLRKDYESRIIQITNNHHKALKNLQKEKLRGNALEAKLAHTLRNYEDKLVEVERRMERAEEQGNDALVARCQKQAAEYEERIRQLEDKYQRSEQLRQEYDERLEQNQKELERATREALARCDAEREESIATVTRRYDERLNALNLELEEQREANRRCQQDVTNCVVKMQSAGADIPSVPIPVTSVRKESIAPQRRGPPPPPPPPMPDDLFAPAGKRPTPDDARNALLAAIRRGKKLRKPSEVPKTPQRNIRGGIQGDLMKALALRRPAMVDISDNDDDWD